MVKIVEKKLTRDDFSPELRRLQLVLVVATFFLSGIMIIQAGMATNAVYYSLLLKNNVTCLNCQTMSFGGYPMKADGTYCDRRCYDMVRYDKYIPDKEKRTTVIMAIAVAYWTLCLCCVCGFMGSYYLHIYGLTLFKHAIDIYMFSLFVTICWNLSEGYEMEFNTLDIASHPFELLAPALLVLSITSFITQILTNKMHEIIINDAITRRSLLVSSRVGSHESIKSIKSSQLDMSDRKLLKTCYSFSFRVMNLVLMGLSCVYTGLAVSEVCVVFVNIVTTFKCQICEGNNATACPKECKTSYDQFFCKLSANDDSLTDKLGAVAFATLLVAAIYLMAALATLFNELSLLRGFHHILLVYVFTSFYSAIKGDIEIVMFNLHYRIFSSSLFDMVFNVVLLILSRAVMDKGAMLNRLCQIEKQKKVIRQISRE